VGMQPACNAILDQPICLLTSYVYVTIVVNCRASKIAMVLGNEPVAAVTDVWSYVLSVDLFLRHCFGFLVNVYKSCILVTVLKRFHAPCGGQSRSVLK